MKWLTLEYIHQHSRIDSDTEDSVLELYANAAEQTVLNVMNRSYEEVMECYGEVPDPLYQAALMLVDLGYQHRSPVSMTTLYTVPYAFDMLIKPHMRLSDYESEHTDVGATIMPKKVNHEQLVALRDAGKMVPGQQYRITDYVATIDTHTNPHARSAWHAFDIIVQAKSASALSEDAWAERHEGDAYFDGCRLEAWKLKYRLDNVNWSKQAGTYATASVYSFVKEGVVTIDGESWVVWRGDEAYAEDWTAKAVSRSAEAGAEMYTYYNEPGTSEDLIGEITAVDVDATGGKGTVTWMKDEWGNECPFDFKNIQTKRWRVTDEFERDGLDGMYVGVLGAEAEGLTTGDDYVWVYAFSGNEAGGEQTDYSLGGHGVHDNVMGDADGVLPDNVLFGAADNNVFGQNCKHNTCGAGASGNKWGYGCQGNSCGSGFTGNTIGNGALDNSFGEACWRNVLGNSCTDNAIGVGARNNQWGDECRHNVCGANMRSNVMGDAYYGNDLGEWCEGNVFGAYCTANYLAAGFKYNTIGNSCSENSVEENCENCSWGNGCRNNVWAASCTNSTMLDGVRWTRIGTANVRNVRVMNGVAGSQYAVKVLAFEADKNYAQVASINAQGVLVINVAG